MKMKPTLESSVNEMRRYLSRQIANKTIATTGAIPSAPSKVIRMATKDTLWKWISNHQIDWANNYDSDGVVLSESSDSSGGGGSSEGNSEETKQEAKPTDANPKGLPELTGANGLPSMSSQGGDCKYITTQGAVGLDVLQNDSGTPMLTEEINKTQQVVNIVNADLIMLEESTRRGINALAEQIDDLDTSGSVSIKINDVEIKTNSEEHYHPKFETIANYLRWDKQVMLVGRAGTGKTTIAHQLADAFGVKFAHLSCSAGMSEAHLLGRMLFDGEYVLADFVDIYENGGVFLFDEFDAMDGNTAVVINSALANGKMSVPNRKDKPTAYRHKDCYIITASNTWGTGYGDGIYAGRNKLDGATLDRFCASRVLFDYDTKLERKLAPNKDIAKALWTLRKRVEKYKLQRIVSTRLFFTANVHTKGGESVKDFFNTVTIDWTDEEKAKVDYDGIIKIAEGGNNA
jgi:hypothetical protein